MYDENIISRMNDYLHKAAQALASWLSVMLPKSGEDWWEECVLSNLSYAICKADMLLKGEGEQAEHISYPG